MLKHMYNYVASLVLQFLDNMEKLTADTLRILFLVFFFFLGMQKATIKHFEAANQIIMLGNEGV